jgi:hypothetical protein
MLRVLTMDCAIIPLAVPLEDIFADLAQIIPGNLLVAHSTVLTVSLAARSDLLEQS